MDAINITKILTYEQVTNVTQNPLIIGIIAGIWFITLALYIIIACCVRARTTSGTKVKGCMLSRITGWIPIFIWIIQGGLILIFLIFPIWLGSKV